MNKNLQIKRMVGLACLAALVVVLQIIADNFRPFGVSITLSLIPIVIGAILFGIKGGAFLGFINGLAVLLSPGTLSFFFPFNPFATILICLLKTTIAGGVSGLVFKILKEKNIRIAVILASIVTPIINTALFAIGCMIFFMPLLESIAPEGSNLYAYLFLVFIGSNFLIEFAVNSIMSPTIFYIVKIAFKNYNLGE